MLHASTAENRRKTGHCKATTRRQEKELRGEREKHTQKNLNEVSLLGRTMEMEDSTKNEAAV
ncbi:hypothetical protein OIU78_015875 [Salix suchowensis]|nr:hypothetical protein OIU78_015875 [Salix suchowensis]